MQLSDGRRSYAFQDILHVQAFGGASPITLGREAIGLSLAFEEHIAKLGALRELGVTQFAGYLQHDNKEETLRVYGETVIPALREKVTAKS